MLSGLHEKSAHAPRTIAAHTVHGFLNKSFSGLMPRTYLQLNLITQLAFEIKRITNTTDEDWFKEEAKEEKKEIKETKEEVKQEENKNPLRSVASTSPQLILSVVAANENVSSRPLVSIPLAAAAAAAFATPLVAAAINQLAGNERQVIPNT
jgi:ElaB/YqjD/DUF883 family membrane-anchored ribosome-binding protein